MLVLVLSAVLSGQSVVDEAPPTGRWAASTRQLAAELLPPELAADAVSHVFGRDPHRISRPIDSVRFDGRVRRSKGICYRKSYHVGYFRETDGGGVEPTSRHTSNMVRLGGCEGTFAHLNSPASLEDGKRVLRWVKWAVETAKSRKPLPFAVSCSDEMASDEALTTYDEDRCAAGARAVLAALPLDKVSIINRAFPRPYRWNISANEPAPGPGFWDVSFNATRGSSSVALVWKPFGVF